MSESVATSIRKTLSATDVGAARTHQAGILIPKDSSVQRFLPKLDAVATNPSVRLLISLPQLNRWTEWRYVYYNGRLHGTSTRNEYRLTGMTADLRELSATPGDILEFTKAADGDLCVSVLPRAFKIDVGEEERTVVLASGWKLVFK